MHTTTYTDIDDYTHKYTNTQLSTYTCKFKPDTHPPTQRIQTVAYINIQSQYTYIQTDTYKY